MSLARVPGLSRLLGLRDFSSPELLSRWRDEDAPAARATPAERVIETSDAFLRGFLKFWLALSVLLFLYTWVWLPKSLYFSSVMLGAGLAGCLAMRGGHKAAARWIFITPMALAVMAAPPLLNGIRTPVIANIPLLLVLVGWMLGRRIMAWMAISVAVLLIAMWQVEARGLWTIQVPLREPGMWFMVFFFNVAFGALIMGSLIGNYQADFRREAELQQRLGSVLQFSEAVILRSPLPMRVFDSAGLCIKVNDAYADLVGLPREKLLHASFRDIPMWDNSGLVGDCEQAIATGCPLDREIAARSASGRLLWLHAYLLPFESEGERNLLVQFIDLTERQRLTKELELLAFRDGLTGLPNRRLFFEHLQKTIHRGRRNATWSAILMLDLDRFKQLNDLHGHEAGDRLLVKIARRLEGGIRASDTAARLGGDEFTILLSELGSTEAEARANTGMFVEKLRRLLERPYQLGGVPYEGTASIGFALIPCTADANAEALMRQADASMYVAKRAARQERPLLAGQ